MQNTLKITLNLSFATFFGLFLEKFVFPQLRSWQVQNDTDCFHLRNGDKITKGWDADPIPQIITLATLQVLQVLKMSLLCNHMMKYLYPVQISIQCNTWTSSYANRSQYTAPLRYAVLETRNLSPKGQRNSLFVLRKMRSKFQRPPRTHRKLSGELNSRFQIHHFFFFLKEIQNT